MVSKEGARKEPVFTMRKKKKRTEGMRGSPQPRHIWMEKLNMLNRELLGSPILGISKLKESVSVVSLCMLSPNVRLYLKMDNELLLRFLCKRRYRL